MYSKGGGLITCRIWRLKDKSILSSCLFNLYETSSRIFVLQDLIKRRERKGTEKLFEEIMAINFLNLEKETDIHIRFRKLSTSCEMQGWVKHKLESRLPGEIQ